MEVKSNVWIEAGGEVVAGGMAGQVRFGARNGGALVILGVLVLILGLFLSDSVATIFKMFPPSILGVSSSSPVWNWLPPAKTSGTSPRMCTSWRSLPVWPCGTWGRLI
jgi:hypothetical protein